MQTLTRKLKREFEPYGDTIPFVKRPKDDLSCPSSDEEKLYCWFYWLSLISNPATTRFALDSMEKAPEFSAEWGSSWSKGEEIRSKSETFINKKLSIYNK